MGDVCAPRVLIVDDHAGFRSVARELLDLRGYAVVGEAECAADALDLVARLGPHAVLLDVRLGAESGFDVARALTHAHPGVAVLLVSADEELEGLARVGASGARGFVAKRRLAQADLDAFWPAAERATCACAAAG